MKKLVSLMMVSAVVLIAGIVMAGTFNAPRKEGTVCQITAGEDILQGWLVCVSTNGLAYGADDTANYKVVGVASESVAAGDLVECAGGIFRYVNAGAFTDKDIGSAAYMWTNTTHYSLGTAAVASADIKAGTIVDVDAGGVWVDTRRQ